MRHMQARLRAERASCVMGRNGGGGMTSQSEYKAKVANYADKVARLLPVLTTGIADAAAVGALPTE